MGMITSWLTPREEGQMTVQLAVVFPVLILVAVITTNALLFFSECASFDRIARETVRVHATAPAYGENLSYAAAAVEQDLARAFTRPYLTSQVHFSSGQNGLVTFTTTLEFFPTLFGMGLRSEIFGVALPPLVHSVTYTVEPYKPGVVI